MVQSEGVSFEDLGWEFYYDEAGHHPLQKESFIGVTPGETLTLYYRSRPVQEEDGYFYGEAISSNDVFPFFFFGLYSREEVLNNIYLFGEPEDDNRGLVGKVESFSMWNEAKDDSFILNYATNQMRMIEDSLFSMYDTIAEAEVDNLLYHFAFDEHSQVVSNYNDSLTLFKNRNMDLSIGKTTNSSVFDEFGDLIILNSATFSEAFTLNFRFMMENIEDTTLFYSPKIGKIYITEDTSTINFDMYPFIGSSVKMSILDSDMRIHHWYDVTIRYMGTIVSIYVDGEKMGEKKVNVNIGGVYILNLDHSNVESIVIDERATLHAFTYDYKIRDPAYPQVMPNDYTFSLEKGSRAMSSLLFGGDAAHTAIPIGDNNQITPFIRVVDEVNGIKEMVVAWGNSAESTIRTNSDSTISFTHPSATYVDTAVADYLTYGNIFWTKILVPNGLVKVVITMKATLSSSIDVFPMIFSIPSLPIKKRKVLLSGVNEYLNVLGNGHTEEYPTLNYAKSGLSIDYSYGNTQNKHVEVQTDNNIRIAFVPGTYFYWNPSDSGKTATLQDGAPTRYVKYNSTYSIEFLNTIAT